MNGSTDCRQRAAQFRHDARQSSRPLTQLMYKKAAQRWDAYADELEHTGSGRIGLVRGQRAFCV